MVTKTIQATNRKETIINLAPKQTLASIIENYSIENPIDISSKICLTENDSNTMIDQIAKAIKFKNIDGDQDNSFEEGKEDEKINLDDAGNYIGKGRTTIYDKDIDLEDETKSSQRWVETPTGKASDGDTEQVPNHQKLENFNESTIEESTMVTHPMPKITSRDIIKKLLKKDK